MICCLTCFVKAEESLEQSSKEEWSDTHIEYSPFGLIKIEIPRGATKIWEANEENKEMKIRRYSVLGPFITANQFEEYPYKVQHTDVLKIPFAEYLHYEDLLSEIKNPNIPTENPFDETWQLDQPVFCLFNNLMIFSRSEQDEKTNKFSKLWIRERYLDSLVFCLFQRAQWGEDRYYYEWFDLPMITTYAYERSTQLKYQKIFETPFTTIYTYYPNKTKLLDFMIVSLYKKDIYKERNSVCEKTENTENIKQNGERSKTTILRTMAILGNWSTFALWQRERFEDKKVCNQFLRLPFLGPVLSSWESPETKGKKNAIFPRLLFGKYPKYTR
jgi:hypothetical protein